MLQKLKCCLPYLFAILFFYVIAYIFSPQVLQNKIVQQSDIDSWRGMANEIVTYNKANPDKDPALWTNSMFSGMPANTISVIYEGDYTDTIYNFIHKVTGVRPPSYLIIAMVGAFLMFLAFGVNIWLAIVGAIAVGFCSYNLQIIQVGHNTKMVAIAFMPWVIASVIYAYKKKPVLGALLFAFALSFQIKANHPQITYYLAMILAAYCIAEFYSAIKGKYLHKFLKTTLLIFAAALLGVATNINHLWPTYENMVYTMRGGSELAAERQVAEQSAIQEEQQKAGEEGRQSQTKGQRRGLDVEYATNWSYSLEETPNLIIPNFNGGSSYGALTQESETYKAIVEMGYPAQSASQAIQSLPLYWGNQPSTAGPMYIGAISIFLFILGLILLSGAQKWWIGIISLLAILLSWGSNLLFLTEFFFNYAPLYNKFRTVSMILVILQITIPILAIITIDKVIKGDYEKAKVKRGITIALAITAGFCLIFALIPTLAGSFVSAYDSMLQDFMRGPIVDDRISLLRADAFRSLVFIVLGAGVVWAGFATKIKKEYIYVALGILILADLWVVDKRYLNDSNFVSKRTIENQYAQREVDKIILLDKDPNYRVLDMSVSTFNNAHVSYHHKSIGGYSAAKLQRYQDIIDDHITAEMRMIADDVNQALESMGEEATIEGIQSQLGEYPALNMLNARYIIVNDGFPPLMNEGALGNAWFVNDLKMVNGAIEEIEGIDMVEVSEQAVVSEEFSKIVAGFSKENLSEDELIVLTEYSPNRLVYQYNTEAERVAIFSEVYYPAGWRAYVDGEEFPIFRANYILRAMKLPAGAHEVEFVYKPESIEKGAFYSRISSGLLILLFLAYIAQEVIVRRKRTIAVV